MEMGDAVKAMGKGLGVYDDAWMVKAVEIMEDSQAVHVRSQPELRFPAKVCMCINKQRVLRTLIARF